MNRDIMEGHWKQLRGRLQDEYGWLTDEELDLIEGDWEALVGRLQEIYGYRREQAEQELERFLLEQRL